MTIPNAQPITLTIGGTDVTAYAPYSSLRLERNNLDVGYLDVVIERSPITVGINDAVILTDTVSSTRLFTGNVIELTETKIANGLSKVYTLRCADQLNRLRRAIVPYLSLFDSDSALLNALFNNSFPDLTDLFDLSGISDLLLDDLDFLANNEDLLTALQRFQDLTGNYLSFTPGSGKTISNYFINPKLSYALDLDAQVRGFPPPYDTYSTNPDGYGLTIASIASGGAISGNYARLPALVSNSSFAGAGYGTVFTLGENAGSVDGVNTTSQMIFRSDLPDGSFVRMTFYLRADANVADTDYNLFISDWLVSDFDGAFQNRFSSSLATGDADDALAANTWIRFSITTPALSNANLRDIADPFRLSAVMQLDSRNTGITFDISNIVFDIVPSTFDFASGATYVDGDSTGFEWEEVVDFSYTLDSSTGKEALNYTDEPLASDFDLDVQLGDEYASDIEFSLGSPDYFNAAIVVGGLEDVAVDWTYESDGAQDHINLETAFSDFIVYRNDGTDSVPSWTALTTGVWGTDTLGVAGIQVLYDPTDHWLYFETLPPNLAKSVRVAGNIKRPIRVQIDNSADGDPVLAATVYDSTITSTDQAVAIGNAELNKRNAPANLRFKTMHPGLLPGRIINVTDSARGLNANAIIQRISTAWLHSSGHAVHDVECGVETPADAASLVAGNDIRSRPSPPPAATTTQEIAYLVDEDGTQLVDADGALLYEII